MQCTKSRNEAHHHAFQSNCDIASVHFVFIQKPYYIYSMISFTVMKLSRDCDLSLKCEPLHNSSTIYQNFTHMFNSSKKNPRKNRYLIFRKHETFVLFETTIQQIWSVFYYNIIDKLSRSIWEWCDLFQRYFGCSQLCRWLNWKSTGNSLLRLNSLFMRWLMKN